MNDTLLGEVKAHWQQLRGMTYDLLDELQEEDLEKRLPFPTSQSLGTQFACMLGTQESWLPLLTRGAWEEWSCSLYEGDEEISLDTIRQHLQEADEQLFEALESGDLLRRSERGRTGLMYYMILVEHEAHHQGQLINFIYAHDLPIPESWAAKWALSREG